MFFYVLPNLSMSIMCDVPVYSVYSLYYLCKCIWLHVFSRCIICIVFVYVYCMYSKLFMGVSMFMCMSMSMYIMFVSVCLICIFYGFV